MAFFVETETLGRAAGGSVRKGAAGGVGGEKCGIVSSLKKPRLDLMAARSLSADRAAGWVHFRLNAYYYPFMVLECVVDSTVQR